MLLTFLNTKYLIELKQMRNFAQDLTTNPFKQYAKLISKSKRNDVPF